MSNYFDDNPRGRSRGSGNDYFNDSRRPAKAPGKGSSRGGRGRKAPIPLLIFIDVLAAALLLLVFYVTNYEMAREIEGDTLPTPSATEVVVAPSATNNPGPTETAVTEEPTPTPSLDPNDWRAKFADKFTTGDVEKTKNTYKSANINVSIEKVQKKDLTYFVADIYVAELKYFKSAFAKKANKMGGRELTDKVAKEVDAILAINGDHCVDNPGPVVRNGKLFRDKKSSLDLLVMNYDGSMKTYSSKNFNLDKIKAEGAYQVWAFGPTLVRDGAAMTKFVLPDAISGKNPRTAVGYYEPGHYCFVVVDGRQSGYSEGMTIDALAKLFADLGCKEAYNMDGGRSAEMVFMGKLASHPMDGRRSTTDILYVGE